MWSYKNGFWTVIEITNICIDLAIAVILCSITDVLQVARTKYILMFVFCLKSL